MPPRPRSAAARAHTAHARRHGTRLGLLWSGGRGFKDGGGEGGALRLQRVRVRGRGLRGGGDGRVALACWRACSAPRVRRECAGGSRARARRHGARLGLLWSGGRGFEDGGGEGGALRLQRVRVRGRGLRGGGRWARGVGVLVGVVLASTLCCLVLIF